MTAQGYIQRNTLGIPSQASKVMQIIQSCLGDSLMAVYLHGSAAGNGLRPQSDIDLIAVVNQPLNRETRNHLTAELMRVSGRHPVERDGPRPIELIVFLNTDLATPDYPARGEFIYGEWLRETFESGAVPGPVSDAELTLLLAQARQEAIALTGPDTTALLPAIPVTDVRRATADALPGLLGTLEGDERNVLLTLVRMWRTLSTGDFVAKDVAADWAIPRLSTEAAGLIADAKEAYRGEKRDDWHTRRHDVQRVAQELGELVAALALNAPKPKG